MLAEKENLEEKSSAKKNEAEQEFENVFLGYFH